MPSRLISEKAAQKRRVQGVTCFDAAIIREDFDPTKVHVTYGIQNFVT